MLAVTVSEYVTAANKSPFGEWVKRLDPTAAAKVFTSRLRLEQGNFSNVKGVGAGVFEYRIDFGPGYRVYFGKDGGAVVILLVGGTKKRQDQDVAEAHLYWEDYKERKKKIEEVKHKKGKMKES